jgi:hypothetical protein
VSSACCEQRRASVFFLEDVVVSGARRCHIPLVVAVPAILLDATSDCRHNATTSSMLAGDWDAARVSVVFSDDGWTVLPWWTENNATMVDN